jgi:hypothetical protein
MDRIPQEGPSWLPGPWGRGVRFRPTPCKPPRLSCAWHSAPTAASWLYAAETTRYASGMRRWVICKPVWPTQTVLRVCLSVLIMRAGDQPPRIRKRGPDTFSRPRRCLRGRPLPQAQGSNRLLDLGSSISPPDCSQRGLADPASHAVGRTDTLFGGEGPVYPSIFLDLFGGMCRSRVRPPMRLPATERARLISLHSSNLHRIGVGMGQKCPFSLDFTPRLAVNCVACVTGS